MNTMQNLCGRLLSLALAAGLAGSAVHAAPERQAALGSQGEIYVAKTGTYGELFPGGTEVKDLTAPVLALEVIQPDGQVKRSLVPLTGGPEVERSPALLYEEDSETVYLVWESLEYIHPLIRLASFDGSTWSPAVRITGNPVAPKTSPQITITRDSYSELVNGGSVQRHRTILHLLWGEETGSSGAYETMYTPVILEDGVYVGWNPIFNMNRMLASPAPAQTSFELAPELVQSPTLQSGSDGRTVMMAFASADSRRLTTVEVDVLPRELVRLADETRSTIIDMGRKATTAPTVRALAERARATILESGAAFFHREVLDALAGQVQGQIQGSNGQSVTSVAEETRSTIIDMGAKFSRRGLRPLNPVPSLASDASTLLDDIEQIFTEGPSAATATSEAHVLHFRSVSSRPAPRTGTEAVKVFASASGENVLVSWQESGRILYKDSQDNSWGDTREIRLSPSLSVEQAYDVLQQRVQNR